MKRLITAALSVFAGAALAQQTVTTTTVVKNVTTTVVEQVTVEQQRSELKKIAVFVQNRTRVDGRDDEMDGVRDRLAAALAEIEGFAVMDSAQVADTFRRYKITTDERRRDLSPASSPAGPCLAWRRCLAATTLRLPPSWTRARWRATSAASRPRCLRSA